MINTGKLAGLTIFITGASRGIGKAIALKAAKDGANIVIAAKTATPHPKLAGTIYTAAEEVEKAGGKALPCIVDVRDEKQVHFAMEETVNKFGGIDILVNNASAISLTDTADTDMKRFDLMHSINTRGTFLVSKECVPYLKKSKNPHILNISPPINLNPHWFCNNVAYTIAKYGMSMCVLGMHEELRPFGIGVNALWPRTLIHTAATEMLKGKDVRNYSRKPEIMADAAYAILIDDPKNVTGNFFIDEDLLKRKGVTDFSQYLYNKESNVELMLDGFVDEETTSISSPSALEKKGTTSTAEASQRGSKIDQLFSVIECSLNEELVSKIKAVYQFVVTGEESGKWYIDLKTGSGKCGKGEPATKADATLTMDSKNFYAMFEGKLKSSNAYMTGKLKISGDLMQAMKLEKLMSKLKSRL